MAKQKQFFICSSCGASHPKWLGRCTECGEWNTISLAPELSSNRKKEKAPAVRLSSIEHTELKRIMTGIGEFDLVCGGGIVPGSVILIGGDPGIGKSTLALQTAEKFKSLYVSGEESYSQIRHRGDRLGIGSDNIAVSTETDVSSIIEMVESKKYECVIVDSIQTIRSADVAGITGSVSQIRESASRLAECAKSTGVPLILIGHITKDGNIAGPKLLEHIVDTVLYFEGDSGREFRILRAFKNRFGSVNEMGLFRMCETGLEEVKNRNDIFLNPFRSDSPGNAISAALEGTRTILFEVQSLVTFTSFPNPRRMSDGFDSNRLIILAAVLEKHAGLKLNNFDIFINVSGGFRIDETSADLAVAMAIASSLKEKPVQQKVGIVGEVSLSGEVRPVSSCDRRINEFRIAGFDTLIVPKGNEKDAAESGYKGRTAGVKTISEAINLLF